MMLKMLGHINDALVRFGYRCNKETRVLIRTHPRTFSYGSKMDTLIDLKRKGMRPLRDTRVRQSHTALCGECAALIEGFSISVWRLKVKAGKDSCRTSWQAGPFVRKYRKFTVNRI